jgi:hypothetical protein
LGKIIKENKINYLAFNYFAKFLYFFSSLSISLECALGAQARGGVQALDPLKIINSFGDDP